MSSRHPPSEIPIHRPAAPDYKYTHRPTDTRTTRPIARTIPLRVTNGVSSTHTYAHPYIIHNVFSIPRTAEPSDRQLHRPPCVSRTTRRTQERDQAPVSSRQGSHRSECTAVQHTCRRRRRQQQHHAEAVHGRVAWLEGRSRRCASTELGIHLQRRGTTHHRQDLPQTHRLSATSDIEPLS